MYKPGDSIVSKNIFFRCASFLTFYSLIGIATCLTFGLYSFKVHNRHRLCSLTKAVTVSNHTMLLDPVFMNIVTRPYHLYQTLLEKTVCSPFIGTFTRLLGGVPIPRRDFNGCKLYSGAKEALRQRRFLHFYPEGECYIYNACPKPFHAGAFITAAVLNVPVVPIATVFKDNGKRPKIHLYILEPINTKDFNVIKADGTVDSVAARNFAEEVRKRIAREITNNKGTGKYYKGHMKRIAGING
ncbi:MAG: 1-acyl-sn-glycerol-3-phosphate acyltransferase [Spirochaetaceae bacterium]|nr:1-acyl-sn-glycerol-3-phosphate acyltransferase [Spirochaetaceae bacterium]